MIKGFRFHSNDTAKDFTLIPDNDRQQNPEFHPSIQYRKLWDI